MIPERIVKTLQCPCHKLPLKLEKDSLVCQNGRDFPIYNGIPSILMKNPEGEIWNPWSIDEVAMSGDSYYKRSIGELPEKEASKSYARFLKKHKLYEKGDTILDFGCATGHFLRSFRRLLDPKVLYTGIDSHLPFLQWGGEAYGIDNTCTFIHCDVLDLPFSDNSYDTSIVNLFHFFPNIHNALKESMRVTKKFIVWRTPIGEKVNYAIKIIMDNDFNKIGIITPDREDIDYDLYMLFTKKYITDLVKSLGGEVPIIEKDTNFKDFDNTALPEFEHMPATKTIDGMQINGNLVLDWNYFVIDCSKVKK